MSISVSDLRHYEAFIVSRGRRTDMGPDFVAGMIRRLETLLEDSGRRKTPDPKAQIWADSLEHHKAVRRCMTAMEATPDAEGDV